MQQLYKDRFIPPPPPSLVVCYWNLNTAVGALFSSPHNDNHIVPPLHTNLCINITPITSTSKYEHMYTEDSDRTRGNPCDYYIPSSQLENPLHGVV